MGRTRNDVNTVQLTISTTPYVVEELKKLVRTGHYGKNAAEAAERLIAIELQKLFGEEAMKRTKRKTKN
jgi:hypothetical protein